MICAWCALHIDYSEQYITLAASEIISRPKTYYHTSCYDKSMEVIKARVRKITLREE